MEDTTSNPQAAFITPSYILLTAIASLSLGIGSWLFFVPETITHGFIGEVTEPLKDYAVHFMVVGVVLFMINAFNTMKRVSRPKQSVMH